MKRILRDTCILAALMILCVFTVSIIWVGLTDEIRLVIYLFCLSFMISAVNYFLDEFTTLPILGTYLVKYLLATGIVMLFGFIAGWFYPSNFWMAFIYVGIVLVLAYSIDSFRVKKDIAYINTRIADRASKNEVTENQ